MALSIIAITLVMYEANFDIQFHSDFHVAHFYYFIGQYKRLYAVTKQIKLDLQSTSRGIDPVIVIQMQISNLVYMTQNFVKKKLKFQGCKYTHVYKVCISIYKSVRNINLLFLLQTFDDPVFSWNQHVLCWTTIYLIYGNEGEKFLSQITPLFLAKISFFYYLVWFYCCVSSDQITTLLIS